MIIGSFTLSFFFYSPPLVLACWLLFLFLGAACNWLFLFSNLILRYKMRWLKSHLCLRTFCTTHSEIKYHSVVTVHVKFVISFTNFSMWFCWSCETDCSIFFSSLSLTPSRRAVFLGEPNKKRTRLAWNAVQFLTEHCTFRLKKLTYSFCFFECLSSDYENITLTNAHTRYKNWKISGNMTKKKKQKKNIKKKVYSMQF